VNTECVCLLRKLPTALLLRFPVFGVEATREVSKSELRQIQGELKRLEAAVSEQLGTFSSVMVAPSMRVQASKDAMAKIMQYAKGKQLFKATFCSSCGAKRKPERRETANNYARSFLRIVLE
jgi:menaquinone-dependent protoporphyrinogen IX oxidase